MSPSCNKLVQLVNLWAELEKEEADLSLDQFCWKVLGRRLARPDVAGSSVFAPNGRTIGLIGRLGKFATLYSKKALAKYELSTVEEWVYLLRLYTLGNPRKSELIHDLLSEFPSGSEIIRRLVDKGLVQESVDPQDRRSRRISISGKGEQLILSSMPSMDRVGSIALDRLDEEEKVVLNYLLEKLDHFHSQHYKEVRKGNFEQVYKKLSSSINEQMD